MYSVGGKHVTGERVKQFAMLARSVPQPTLAAARKLAYAHWSAFQTEVGVEEARATLLKLIEEMSPPLPGESLADLAPLIALCEALS